MRIRIIQTAALLVLVAATSAIQAQGAPSPQACHARVNNTVAKLLECTQAQELWRHLEDFQAIADQNPGTSGHPNRDTGSPGYKASVDYVATLMRQAGYQVGIQTYVLPFAQVVGTPRLTLGGRNYTHAEDWAVARQTGAGTIAAPVQAASGSGTGCGAGEFVGFRKGGIAVLQRGGCAYDVQVARAQEAGAAAVVLCDCVPATTDTHPVAAPARSALRTRLTAVANVPVISVASDALNAELKRRLAASDAANVQLEVHTNNLSVTDYNVIAESPFGDPSHVVVVEGHLDSIFGAGILDNASGSATMLDIGLNLAHTPTRKDRKSVV